MLAQAHAIMLRQPVEGDEADVVRLEFAHQVGKDALLFILHRGEHFAALRDLLARRAAVDGGGVDAGGDLLLEPADAFHEEFIQVVADDGQELDPLQQRRAWVVRLVQDALVEREPGQLAVQVQAGVVEVEGRFGLRRLFDDGCRGRFVVEDQVSTDVVHGIPPVVGARLLARAQVVSNPQS
jgi:hypothetical protein